VNAADALWLAAIFAAGCSLVFHILSAATLRDWRREYYPDAPAHIHALCSRLRRAGAWLTWLTCALVLLAFALEAAA